VKSARLQLILLLFGGYLAFVPGNVRCEPDPAHDAAAAKNPLSDARQLDADRTRVQLLTRLGKYFEAKAMAELILEKHPGDHATLILLADLYAEQKNAEGMYNIGKELTRLYPDQPEGPYYTASSALLDHQPKIAYMTLRGLKDVFYRENNFPYQADLAEAAKDAGDRQTAIEEYKKALQSPSLSPQEYGNLRRTLDQLYDEELSNASITSDYTWLSKNTLWRQEAEFETPVDGGIRVGAGFRRDEISIEPGVTLPGVREVRQDGFMKIIQDYDARWRSTWIIGGWARQPLGGVEMLRQDDKSHVQLSILANEPAHDSLRLESLDGRQHRIGLETSLTPTPNDYLFTEMNGRLIMLDDRELGKSDDFLYGYERTVLRDPTLLVIGYRGTDQFYSQTTKGTDLVAGHFSGVDQSELEQTQQGLVTSYQNLEGVYLRHTWEPVSFISWTQLYGVDYSGEAGKFEDYLFSTLAFKPRKCWEISLRGGYQSSASSSNYHSEAYEMVIASEYRF